MLEGGQLFSEMSSQKLPDDTYAFLLKKTPRKPKVRIEDVGSSFSAGSSLVFFGMANKPKHQPTKSIPAEDAESLKGAWKWWQVVFTVGITFLVGCAGWFALQVNNLQLAVRDLKDVPTDIKQINGRLAAVESSVGALGDLPKNAAKLSVSADEVKAEVATIRTATGKLKELEDKVKEMSVQVTAVSSSLSEQKQVTEKTGEAVKQLGINLQKQSDEIAAIKRQVTTLSATAPSATKRLLIQAILPDKPLSTSEEDGVGRIVFQPTVRLPEAVYMGATQVDFLEIREREALIPLASFTVQAELSEEKHKIRLVFSTDKPQEFLGWILKSRAVVTVAVSYR